MYWLYRDPEGKKIFEGPSAVDSRAGGKNSSNTSGTDVAASDKDAETVSQLKKRVKELESKLNSNVSFPPLSIIILCCIKCWL